jgi:hypothetical protein
MKNAVFRDVTTCSLTGIYQSLEKPAGSMFKILVAVVVMVMIVTTTVRIISCYTETLL